MVDSLLDKLTHRPQMPPNLWLVLSRRQHLKLQENLLNLGLIEYRIAVGIHETEARKFER